MTPNPLLVILAALSVFAQSDTRASVGQQAILTATGKGVQIYGCQNAQWVFQIPEAILFDSAGQQIGTHGAGPVWTLSLAATRRTPQIFPGCCLLKGRGSFEYIRRSDTRGGVAPEGACETGRTLRVDYSAVYTFYTHR